MWRGWWSWWLVAVAAAAAAPRCPEPPPGSEADSLCRELGSSQNEYFFQLYGNTSVVVEVFEGVSSLQCGGLALHDPALPAPPPRARLVFRRCRIPRGPLRVSAHKELALLQLAEDDVRAISAETFSLLAHLTALELAAAEGSAELAEDALRPLSALHTLKLENVSGARSLQLPPSLRELSVRGAGAAVPDAPAAAALTRLTVSGPQVEEAAGLAAGGALRSVWVGGGGALRLEAADTAALAALRNVTLAGVAAVAAEQWAHAPALERLSLLHSPLDALPDRWLAGLGNLTAVLITRVQLVALPPRLLDGSAALQELEVSWCRLRALPASLLRDLPRLQVLRLQHNHLVQMDAVVWVRAMLVELDVSHNAVSGAELARALGEGGDTPPAAAALQVLTAGSNPLGDLCRASPSAAATGASFVQALGAVRRVSLRAAGITRVCSDWRRLPSAALLDLAHNNITHLNGWELQWTRAGPSVVDLSYNPLRHLYFSHEDYDQAADPLHRSVRGGGALRVVLRGAPLACDCRLYWWLRARTLYSMRDLQLEELRCSNGTAAQQLDARALSCDVTQEARCAAPSPRAACTCSLNVHARTTLLDCTLTAPPPPPPPPPTDGNSSSESASAASVVDLRGVTSVGDTQLSVQVRVGAGAGAGGVLWPPATSDLSLAGDDLIDLSALRLPHNLTVLDVRGARLAWSAESVAALLSARALLLAGAALDCACDVRPAPWETLARHSHQVRDWEAVRCADGTRPPAACAPPPAAPWLGALLAGAALAAACACALRAPCVRVRLARLCPRQALPHALRLGYGVSPAADADPDNLWDVFLSFSHCDEAAGEALYAGLRARRLRVCVHCASWPPGEPIAAHVARSVAHSRRTLALLSQAALRSHWCLEEVGAALRARRLVLVLLEPAAALQAALRPPSPPALHAHTLEQLREYMRTHTYAEYAQGSLWDKLERAIGKPAPLPAAPAPAAPPAH